MPDTDPMDTNRHTATEARHLREADIATGKRNVRIRQAAVRYIERHNEDCDRYGEPDAKIVAVSLRGTRLVTRFVTPMEGEPEFNATRIVLHDENDGYHFDNLASGVPKAHALCFPAVA